MSDFDDGSTLSPPSPARLGRYRIVRPLGKGGMGCVFEAFDEQLERKVALKIPHPLLRGTPETVERFLREARAAAQLMHRDCARCSMQGSMAKSTTWRWPISKAGR